MTSKRTEARLAALEAALGAAGEPIYLVAYPDDEPPVHVVVGEGEVSRERWVATRDAAGRRAVAIYVQYTEGAIDEHP